MAKPVKAIRGEPTVMPFTFCQWFDHEVRFRFARPNTAWPTFTSLTARLLSTCVNWPSDSRLYSLLVPVDPENPLLPAPKGSKISARENLPINRVRDDSW